DLKSFNPVFSIGGTGFGAPFRILTCACLAALVFSRVTPATHLCLFILLTSVAVPAKYIGYNRYFPQMWALAPLALFNLAAHPRIPRLGRFAAPLAIAPPVLLAALCLARTLAQNAFWWRTASEQAAAISAIARMPVKSVPAKFPYTFRERLAFAGITPEQAAADGDATIKFELSPAFIHPADDPGGAAAAVKKESAAYWRMNSFSLEEVFTAPFWRAYLSPPRPLWKAPSLSGD
ncbi:MAG: hypothetical protein IJ802_05120, partial [Kiritimatiellae bacterium]|nr:hypothetical protein [Kiritimatiellia bacterium]